MVIYMKKEGNVSRQITQYIKDNKISITQIALDTGISEEKLKSEDISFNATEFLEICSYLNLHPEDMM